MNNWRLLLFALVAVFQPIASFTERNYVDGRQQCCDQQSPTPLPDTRSPLHGTQRIGKTISALRREDDRDKTREDLRYELKHFDFVSSRPSTERRLLEVRERSTKQGPSVITRSTRVESRLERTTYDQNRNQQRLGDVLLRKSTANRNIRHLSPENNSRRIIERTSRDAFVRRDSRANTESSRDNIRASRLSNEHLPANLFDSQREMQKVQRKFREIRSTANREADVLQQTRNDIARKQASNYLNNRQHNAKERLSVVRREASARAESRNRVQNNNERQELRLVEQRRALSENTRLVEEIYDMRIDLNSRKESREDRNRIIGNLRLSTERFDQRRQRSDVYSGFRHQNKENNRSYLRERMPVQKNARESRIFNVINSQEEEDVDRHSVKMFRVTRNRRVSRERVQGDRRNIRESTVNERDMRRQWEVRAIEKTSRDSPDEMMEYSDSRLIRERHHVDQRVTRESRFKNLHDEEVDTLREIRYNEIVSRHSRRDSKNLNRRHSRERIQMQRKNIREFRTMNGIVNRYDRDIESQRDNDRISRETLNEIRDNLKGSVSRERIRLNRRNNSELRKINNMLNGHDSDNEIIREIRYNDRTSRNSRDEIRENHERSVSRERIQLNRRNDGEFRKMNDRVNRHNSDHENRREVIYNDRMSRNTRDEIQENDERSLSRERMQLDRKNIRESRILKTLNKRDVDSRREIRENDRMSRDTRNENRRNVERRSHAQENRQIDRSLIRETRKTNDMKHVAENRPERYNEKATRQIYDDQFNWERRKQSKSLNRVMPAEKDNIMTERRAHSVERQNFREIRAEPMLNRSAKSIHASDVFRNRVEYRKERETNEGRFHNFESDRNRERIGSALERKPEIDNESNIANWQYVLYTLQGAYLCALFMQMLTPSRTDKANMMSLRWLPLSSHYNPIKVD